MLRYRSMAGFRTPYVPGYDCHGLPIEQKVADKLGPKLREMEKVEVRRLCAEHAEKFIGVQSGQFRRLGILGAWAEPYATMRPGYERRVLEVFADFVANGLVYRQLKAGPLVDRQPHRARRRRARIPRRRRPERLRRAAAQQPRRGQGAVRPARAGRPVLDDLDHDPLDAPGQPGRGGASRRRVRFRQVRPRRGAGERRRGRVAAEGLRRGGRADGAENGARPGPAGPSVPPPARRQRPAGRRGRVRHDERRHRPRPHGPPATARTTTRPARKHGLEIYCPVGPDGRLDSTTPNGVSGLKVFDANPVVIDLLKQAGTLFRRAADPPQLPARLAEQDQDDLPRHRAMVHRVG